MPSRQYIHSSPSFSLSLDHIFLLVIFTPILFFPSIPPTTHHVLICRLDFIEYDIEGHNEAAMSINEANGVVGEDESRVNAIDYESSVAADCKTDRITMRTMHSEEDIVPPICARKIGHHGRRHIGALSCHHSLIHFYSPSNDRCSQAHWPLHSHSSCATPWLSSTVHSSMEHPHQSNRV